MNLKPYQEIIGTLHQISTHPLGTRLIITIHKEIILPIEPNTIKYPLGKQIRIFNNNGLYIIKEVIT